MLFQQLRWKPDNYHYIFCINPGRSGSKYLAELLDTANNARAFHEPEPTMTAKHLLSVMQCNYPASYDERSIKLEGITKLCRKVPKGGYYIETNHMFIKTFFDVVMHGLPNVQVIHLQREMSAVLKSFIEMNYFTDNNRAWPKWMTAPTAATRAMQLPLPYDEMDQVDKCIAYLIDIEARAARFRQEFPNTRVLRIRLDELNDVGKVSRIFNMLGLQFTENTEALCGTRVNCRQGVKAKQSNFTTIKYCKQRLLHYFDLLEQNGIACPEVFDSGTST